MPVSQTASQDSSLVFACGSVSYTVRDVIHSAFFRGELEPLWSELLRLVACEKEAATLELELDESASDEMAEKFRYEHDLITAEETEQWLQERGLTLDDFSDYFARHIWGNSLRGEVEAQAIDYASAPDELRALLRTELLLSGECDRMATRLSWRVAANAEAGGEDIDPQAAERNSFFERAGIDAAMLADWLGPLGRDAPWLAEMLGMEARYRRQCAALLKTKPLERELVALRLPLTRFDVEIVELESQDAAREALLCVRNDGLSMAEVAAEGRYPYRRTELVLEDIAEDRQQKFLSVAPGDLLEPLARGDGFQLCRVVGKNEPKVDDPTVRNRIERRILERHFAELAAKHIQWRLVLSSPE